MDNIQQRQHGSCSLRTLFLAVSMVFALLIAPFNIFSENPQKPIKPQRRSHPVDLPDSILVSQPVSRQQAVQIDSINAALADTLTVIPVDTIGVFDAPAMAAMPDTLRKGTLMVFNPDPTRAVWMSALFPGLGQAYNRRWWKLPLVAAGFMGLAYGTSWNNGMLTDYTKAYSDIMYADPNTKSYMDFFPSTTKEEDLDKTWLTNILKSRKDYYRRNRDLCIICMVGVYLLAMVDAYVDAQLAHFDISPDLSMDVAPALIPDTRNRPGFGLQWAFTF